MSQMRKLRISKKGHPPPRPPPRFHSSAQRALFLGHQATLQAWAWVRDTLGLCDSDYGPGDDKGKKGPTGHGVSGLGSYEWTKQEG